MTEPNDIVRFTFDCPTELHNVAKMKAAALKQSVKEYLISLIMKDAVETSPDIISDRLFSNELKKLQNKDADLLKRLSKK